MAAWCLMLAVGGRWVLVGVEGMTISRRFCNEICHYNSLSCGTGHCMMLWCRPASQSCYCIAGCPGRIWCILVLLGVLGFLSVLGMSMLVLLFHCI